MGRPSKLTTQRRATILHLVIAGASIREASRAVGLDHSTVVKWLARGKTSAPGTRLRRFYDEVDAARTDGPRLVDLQRELRAQFEREDLAWAMKFLDDDWRPDPPDPPPSYAFEVRLHDGSPLIQSPLQKSPPEE